MIARIFVYGTLKRGCSNHGYLANQQFVGEAETQPNYRLCDMGGYPGMVTDSGNGLPIQGEVWDVDERCLAALDELEGIDEGEYVREFIPLLAPFDQEQIQGYRYLLPVTGCRDVGAVW